MEYTIEKFLRYLEKYIEKQKEEMSNAMHVEYKKNKSMRKLISFTYRSFSEYEFRNIFTILEFFSTSKEDLIKSGQIFVDYNILSKYLVKFPSDVKERTSILIETIKNNIEVINSKENMCENPKGEITFFNGTEFSNYFFKVIDKILLRKKIKARKKFEENNIDRIIKYNKIIQERYFDKLEWFEEDDINIITQTLKEMMVNEQMCNEINELLMKDYRRRIRNKNKENNSHEYVKTIKKEHQKEVTNKCLSKKDYHEKISEVSNYFNLKDMEAIRYISTSEKIELIRLLHELNYQNKDIEPIMKIIDVKNKIYEETMHPMILFMDFINKVTYYKEKLGLSEQQLEDLKYNFAVLFMCENDEYIEWKNELKKTLETIASDLPKNHEYEIEQTQKVAVLTNIQNKIVDFI